jgi:hypothetical protein
MFPRVTPLPADGGPVPSTIVAHHGHAIGTPRVLLPDRGVLLAGDMLSAVLIPLRFPRRSIRWAPTRRRSTGRVKLPDTSISSSWQGGVAEGPEVAERLAADHAYIDALRPAPALPRLGLRSDVAIWLVHQALVAPTSRW